MSCREEMEMLVSAYIDNEVTEQERDTVERHLQTCASCQAAVASFSKIHVLYRELEVKQAPRDFRQHVTQRLDEQPRWMLPWRISRLVYVCSFVVLVLFGGLMATLSPLWFSVAPETSTVAQVVDIYAEDILFGGTALALDDILIVDDADLTEESSVSGDFLDSIDFFDDETSGVDDTDAEHQWFGWLDPIQIGGMMVS